MKYPDDFIDQVILGDCLEVMKGIPDESIDLVVTDPPYSVGTTSTGNKGSWTDNNLIRPFFEIFFNEVKRVLKSSGEFYINTDWRTYPLLFPLIISASLVIKNCIFWDYGWFKAGSHYRFSHEFIIYGLKNNETKRKFSASERDVWRIPPINFTQEKKHPAEKPEELIEKMIINSTNENDLVLDPFLGSGTTAVAAKKLGRHYIGIEIEPKYVEIAKKRLNFEMLNFAGGEP